MSIADDVYNQLISMGYVRTQTEFSEVFLGKSARYYSFLLATARTPPPHVLLALAMRLERLSALISQTRPCDVALLESMSTKVRNSAEAQSVLAIPRRHRVRSVADQHR